MKYPSQLAGVIVFDGPPEEKGSNIYDGESDIMREDGTEIQTETWEMSNLKDPWFNVTIPIHQLL